MLLGAPSLFERAHYEAHRGVAPAYLAELVVHCLELVAQLSARGLEFRFKGGNSQLILLEQPSRFSIDVDIVTTVDKEVLRGHVEAIVASCQRFTRCEVRPHKTKPWLPILSFRLFFDSLYGRADSHVILDAVFEPAPYPGTRKTVECGALYRCDETVELPTVSGLLADKMLCISPATVGIPLGKNKEAHRLKHVFDVANLSRHAPSWPDARAALDACLVQENAIQKTEFTFEEVERDTVSFCEAVLAHEELPESAEAGTYLDEILRGFPGVAEFLFRHRYEYSSLREDCRAVIDAFARCR